MEIEWALAIGFEAAFWLMLAAFLVLRYRLGIEAATRPFVIGVVLDTAAILALGVWDFAETGHVNVYTLFIAALLAYGLTSGRRHFEHLDAWMERRVRPAAPRARV